MRSPFLAVVVVSVAVSACGGSSDTSINTPEVQYQELLKAAREKKAVSMGLATLGPCTSDNQCSTLNYRSVGSGTVPCAGITESADYSLVSPAAASASAAAADYEVLIKQAEAVAPPPPSNVSTLCVTRFEFPPPLICMEDKCTRSYRLNGPG